jgi:hypothetical protein
MTGHVLLSETFKDLADILVLAMRELGFTVGIGNSNSDAFSMAGIAKFPWARSPEKRDTDVAEFPDVARWLGAIAARSAVPLAVVVMLAFGDYARARRSAIARARPAFLTSLSANDPRHAERPEGIYRPMIK